MCSIFLILLKGLTYPLLLLLSAVLQNDGLRCIKKMCYSLVNRAVDNNLRHTPDAIRERYREEFLAEMDMFSENPTSYFHLITYSLSTYFRSSKAIAREVTSCVKEKNRNKLWTKLVTVGDVILLFLSYSQLAVSVGLILFVALYFGSVSMTLQYFLTYKIHAFSVVLFASVGIYGRWDALKNLKRDLKELKN